MSFNREYNTKSYTECRKWDQSAPLSQIALSQREHNAQALAVHR